MHIYNWYHSDVTGIPYIYGNSYDVQGATPLLFSSPCWFPFWPLSTYLETLLAVTGSIHLGLRSPVACKLNSPFPSPCPYTPSPKIPTPRGSSHPNIHLLGRHCELGSQDPAHLAIAKTGVFNTKNLLNLCGPDATAKRQKETMQTEWVADLADLHRWRPAFPSPHLPRASETGCGPLGP
jgi:hypothetical protein